MKQNFCCLDEPEVFAYKNYLQWEENGGEELELLYVNLELNLSNQQKLWFAMAHSSMLKYNSNIPDSYDAAKRSAMDQLHTRYHSFWEFQTAFHCDELQNILFSLI